MEDFQGNICIMDKALLWTFQESYKIRNCSDAWMEGSEAYMYLLKMEVKCEAIPVLN
jgi:hypothetical protein